MSESNSENYVTNVNEAWAEVGEAVAQATGLYMNELSAYLDWAQDFQREILEQSLLTTRGIARFGEKQRAFFARIRDSVPMYGNVPKGTETVAGMVEAVVREAEPKA
ncbi:MAG: hypothetical protein WB947_02910 [Thermoplasmata archaeon]